MPEGWEVFYLRKFANLPSSSFPTRKGKAMSTVSSNGFRVWKIIVAGPGIRECFRRVLSEAGRAVIPEETQFDLVKVTVADLGFEEGAQLNQIYARAEKLGLELCPPEVGEQLEFQYDGQCIKQSEGASILIAMEAMHLANVPGYGGHYVVFFMADESTDPYAKIKLFRKFINPGHIWAPDDEWVFVRPRK